MRNSTRALLLLTTAALALTVGCGHEEYYVRERAANDFSCERSNIEVSSAGSSSSFRANGCDQAATYTCRTPWGGELVCEREGNVEKSR